MALVETVYLSVLQEVQLYMALVAAVEQEEFVHLEVLIFPLVELVEQMLVTVETVVR